MKFKYWHGDSGYGHYFFRKKGEPRILIVADEGSCFQLYVASNDVDLEPSYTVNHLGYKAQFDLSLPENFPADLWEKIKGVILESKKAGFFAKQPTELKKVSGYTFYEDPNDGDEVPVWMLRPDGMLIHSDWFDVPTEDEIKDYCLIDSMNKEKRNEI